jgi:hypothetical protein
MLLTTKLSIINKGKRGRVMRNYRISLISIVKGDTLESALVYADEAGEIISQYEFNSPIDVMADIAIYHDMILHPTIYDFWLRFEKLFQYPIPEEDHQNLHSLQIECMIQGFQDVIYCGMNDRKYDGEFITNLPELSEHIHIAQEDPKLFGITSLFIRASNYTAPFNPFEQERMAYFYLFGFNLGVHICKENQSKDLFEDFMEFHESTQPYVDKRVENGGFEISITHEVGLFYSNQNPCEDVTSIAKQTREEALGYFKRFLDFYEMCCPDQVKRGIVST